MDRPHIVKAVAGAASIAVLLAAGPAFARSPGPSHTHASHDQQGPGDQHGHEGQRDSAGAVYAISNEASGNRLLFYRRAVDGALTPQGSVATGGNGTGLPRLSSQNSVILDPAGRRLFAVNPGSNQISSFRIGRSGRPELADTISSQGNFPDSLTLDGNVLYVVNHGGATGPGDIAGFTVSPRGTLTPLPGSVQPLSIAGFTKGGAIGFAPDGRSLIVTEEATNAIDRFPLDQNRVAGPAVVHASAAATPFGFAFTRGGALLVSDAVGATPGQATESSYQLTGQTGLNTINGSVPSGQTEVCWTVLNNNQRYAYVTNFSSGTISSYRVAQNGSLTLANAVVAQTSPGQKSTRDENFTPDGRFLYAIDVNAQKVFGWRINNLTGALIPVGSFPGLPATVAGIAVR